MLCMIVGGGVGWFRYMYIVSGDRDRDGSPGRMVQL